MLTKGYAARELPLATIARATAEYQAVRFGLPGKGRVVVGADADLALVDLDAESVLESDNLFYRHRHSPYVGMRLQGRIIRTLVRGATVCHDGTIVSEPLGRLVTPSPYDRSGSHKLNA
jgi:allantoinase